MNQVYFKNIQQIIVDHLEKSNDSIRIAVAWFTDLRIIKVLEKCLDNGINIKIILTNDRINDKEIYRELVNKGADVRFTKSLMHNKFCVIDNSILLNGSYNWTYNAKLNNENINVINDYNLCSEFLSEFDKIFSKAVSIKTFIKSDEEKLSEFMIENELTFDFPYFYRKEVRDGHFWFLLRSRDDIKKLQKGVESFTGGISRFFKTNYENCFNENRLIYFDNVPIKNENSKLILFNEDTIVVENYYQRDTYTITGTAYSINKNGEKLDVIYFDKKDDDGNYIMKNKSKVYGKDLKEIIPELDIPKSLNIFDYNKFVEHIKREVGDIKMVYDYLSYEPHIYGLIMMEGVEKNKIHTSDSIYMTLMNNIAKFTLQEIYDQTLKSLRYDGYLKSKPASLDFESRYTAYKAVFNKIRSLKLSDEVNVILNNTESSINKWNR